MDYFPSASAFTIASLASCCTFSANFWADMDASSALLTDSFELLNHSSILALDSWLIA